MNIKLKNYKMHYTVDFLRYRLKISAVFENLLDADNIKISVQIDWLILEATSLELFHA